MSVLEQHEIESLRQAVRELYAAIVHGPDGHGALDPHPEPDVGAYITDEDAQDFARLAVHDTMDLRP